MHSRAVACCTLVGHNSPRSAKIYELASMMAVMPRDVLRRKHSPFQAHLMGLQCNRMNDSSRELTCRYGVARVNIGRYRTALSSNNHLVPTVDSSEGCYFIVANRRHPARSSRVSCSAVTSSSSTPDTVTVGQLMEEIANLEKEMREMFERRKI